MIISNKIITMNTIGINKPVYFAFDIGIKEGYSGQLALPPSPKIKKTECAV